MKNDGGPAFPLNFTIRMPEGSGLIPTTQIGSGMSLRDYFAAAALQGILAANYDPYGGEKSAASDDAACALHSYNIADAMLAERDK